MIMKFAFLYAQKIGYRGHKDRRHPPSPRWEEGTGEG